jgi:hypothetical protein
LSEANELLSSVIDQLGLWAERSSIYNLRIPQYNLKKKKDQNFWNLNDDFYIQVDADFIWHFPYIFLFLSLISLVNSHPITNPAASPSQLTPEEGTVS